MQHLTVRHARCCWYCPCCCSLAERSAGRSRTP